MAIIIAKDSKGNPIKIKSIVFPPTREEEKTALEFDAVLKKRIPSIENELIDEGLLHPEILDQQKISRGGSIKLWFTLGKKLRELIKNSKLVKPKEYCWALEAVKMYATSRILRKDRGSRLHLDYCIRVSELPWKFVKKLNWDDWVFFLDSKSLRQELRTDKWLQNKIEKLSKLDRSKFRELAKRLNAEFKDIDTSLYSDQELFAVYDSVLENVISDSSKNHRK